MEMLFKSPSLNYWINYVSSRLLVSLTDKFVLLLNKKSDFLSLKQIKN